MSKKNFRLTERDINKEDSKKDELDKDIKKYEYEFTEVKEVKLKDFISRAKELSRVYGYNSSYFKHFDKCYSVFIKEFISKDDALEFLSRYRNGDLMPEYRAFFLNVIEEVFK